jgi:hypothetical protein
MLATPASRRGFGTPQFGAWASVCKPEDSRASTDPTDLGLDKERMILDTPYLLWIGGDSLHMPSNGSKTKKSEV